MTGNLLKDGFTITPGRMALVTIIQDPKNPDAVKQSGAVPRETGSSDWSLWGDDNLFPQNVLSDLEGNSIALRALEKRRNVHFGRGIVAYRNVKADDGTFTREIITEGPVKDFFRSNQVNLQWIDLIGSLEIFANGWLEFILNKAKTQINRVSVMDPAYCRHSRMNPKAIRIEKTYYSADWPNPGEEYLSVIPTFNPNKFMPGKAYPDPKFTYPVFYRSFNKSYYHLAIWNGVRQSGWLSIANKVPALKKAIMKNQMTIKYHVEIPDQYFQKRYPSSDYTREQRESAVQRKIEELNEFLTDVENSGKSLVTFSYYNETLQKEFPGWKINVIDNKLKDDAYLPDSQAANSEILFAIGVDPSLIGASHVPGGKMASSGSGSDKREAFWALNAECGPYREVTLQPLYFIRDFNGWGDDIDFDYVVVDTSQTQDQHPTKTEKRIDTNA
ncbi:MAG: hypothetical protein JW902_09375 [Syntrophaceae bacterium]|nr:hypothetical protein [Syntrophaceae bacterium]